MTQQQPGGRPAHELRADTPPKSSAASSALPSVSALQRHTAVAKQLMVTEHLPGGERRRDCSEEQKPPNIRADVSSCCGTCGKPWTPDRADPTEVFFPDEDAVLPYKCPACCKVGLESNLTTFPPFVTNTCLKQKNQRRPQEQTRKTEYFPPFFFATLWHLCRQLPHFLVFPGSVPKMTERR